jgi:homocysteine S-methyltransferase
MRARALRTNLSSSHAKDFRERLGERMFVADGAMGTMLYSRGVFINRCFDELNLSAPQLVSTIHQEYAAAGAEILETNTYGANQARLKSFGLADQLEAINSAGVRLARQAAQGRAFVAGAMGPLGVHIEPLGTVPAAEARAIFRQQADALCQAGADLLILETFTDLHELYEAVMAARDAAGKDMVIVAQVAIDDAGELPGRTSLRRSRAS